MAVNRALVALALALVACGGGVIVPPDADAPDAAPDIVQIDAPALDTGSDAPDAATCPTPDRACCPVEGATCNASEGPYCADDDHVWVCAPRVGFRAWELQPCAHGVPWCVDTGTNLVCSAPRCAP